jgi:hypothetical protein
VTTVNQTVAVTARLGRILSSIPCSDASPKKFKTLVSVIETQFAAATTL